MRKVISLRLSDAEDARVRGAAAVAGMTVSGYLKWLITHGRVGAQVDTETILHRLDALGVAVANLKVTAPSAPRGNYAYAPARSAIVARLKERGVPTSTIRQVEAAWDEVERKTARAAVLPQLQL